MRTKGQQTAWVDASMMADRGISRMQEGLEMITQNYFRAALVVAAMAATGLAALDAAAQDRVRWKMQSAFSSNLPGLGTSAMRFIGDVERISQGTLRLEFFEPGALVPALECFEAASQGGVDACWTTAGYHTGKIPALAFFTAVPFGPHYGEYFAWMNEGGGKELENELYAKNNLYSLDCNAIGPETSGWFRNPIESLDELKGLKMRFFGLGAQVMQKLGVNTQLLAGADIYPALERGVIDATEFSMPAMDVNLGFYQIVKNNYFPGWHQQISLGELLMHKPAWDELSDWHKAVLEITCGNNIHVNYAETERQNPEAMNQMAQQHGVKVQRWNDEQLAAFEKAWHEVLQEESERDPVFKQVADSYLAFRDKYKVWGNAQALKATYITQ
jgi:TRAP-type mannitol/chloroaromatic compound transport system substrate-binding protein